MDDMSDPEFLILRFLTVNPLATTLATLDGVPVYRIFTDCHPFRSKVTTIVRYDGLGPRYPTMSAEAQNPEHRDRIDLSFAHIRERSRDEGTPRRRDGGTEVARVVWQVWPRPSHALTLHGRDVNAEEFLERRGMHEKTQHLHASRATYEWFPKSDIKDLHGNTVAKVHQGKIKLRPLRFIPTTFRFRQDLDVTTIDEIITAYVLRSLTWGFLLGSVLGSDATHQFLLHLDFALILAGG